MSLSRNPYKAISIVECSCWLVKHQVELCWSKSKTEGEEPQVHSGGQMDEPMVNLSVAKWLL